MWRKYPGSRRNAARIMDCHKMSTVRGAPDLSADRSVSGASVVCAYEKACALGRAEIAMFDPDAHIPRPNRALIYMGACMIAGIRLAREKQVNVRVIPTSYAIDEFVELAHEIINRVFRKVPERMK
jgi:hypothetical protein